ncbi:MAG: HDIG domain-containing metalloprotein, partial [Candidatus Eisenbacteria bacterium]
MNAPRKSFFTRMFPKEGRVMPTRLRGGILEKRLHLLQKLAIGIGFVVAAVVLLPAAPMSPESQYREGDVSEKPVVAPFEFNILKSDEQYGEERTNAADAVLPVFTVDGQQTSRCMAKLAALRQAVEENQGDPAKPLDLSRLGDVRLSPETQSALSQKDVGLEIVTSVERFAARTLGVGVVRTKRAVELSSHEIVRVRSARNDFETPVAALLDKGAVIERATAEAGTLFRGNPQAASAFVDITQQIVEANASYDESATELERAKARSSIPRFEGVVLQGERIIGSHERITPEHLKKLRSLEFYKRGLGEKVANFSNSLPYAGRAALACLFVFMFASYLRMRRRKVWADNHLLLLVAVVCVLVLGLGSLVLNTLRLSAYVVPIVVVPFLLTLLLDDEVALIASVFLTALTGTLAGLDLMFITVSLVAVTTAVYTVAGVRQRRQFYRAMLFVSLSYVVSIFVAGLSFHMDGAAVVRTAGFGILNSFLCTVMAMAGLPVVESLFGLTTNITLLELSDLNRPILRRMMIEAPGTYHHSMVVGNLAEAAAETIGANSLLARVASYYHDIGKIGKPEYFIENQKNARSRHDRLTPTMSCLILESHVREGVQIAEEERLPKIIRQLIEEHHGTTLMAFFYQKALELDSDAPADEYKYPGPKPSSKEAAIIMLAD